MKRESVNIVILAYFSILLSFSGCGMKSSEEKKEQYKKEIFAVEKEFEAMAKAEGIPAAFTKFAAEDGVIMRGDTVIAGKSAIHKFYSAKNLIGHKLEWTADFIYVAESGDLAYTYGKYIYTITDSTGAKSQSKGYFHSVWKRQENGEWRFVWD